MHTRSSFSLLGLLSAIAIASAACGSSDPAPPSVDPGQKGSNGGSSQGAAGSPGAAGNTQANPGAGGQAPGAGGSDQGAGGAAAAGGDQGAGGGAAGGAAQQGPSYPPGPYGLKVGDVVQDFTFFGLTNPKAAGYDPGMGANIAFDNFYNPTKDSSKPRFLIVTASARWCTYCKMEASESMANFKYWNPKGVEFMTALFQDDSNPPQMAGLNDLQAWTKTYALAYPVVLDPSLSLGAFFDSSAAPWNMVLDLSTMTMIFGQQGAVDFSAANPTLKAALGQ